jgi:hypothetical protein
MDPTDDRYDYNQVYYEKMKRYNLVNKDGDVVLPKGLKLKCVGHSPSFGTAFQYKDEVFDILDAEDYFDEIDSNTKIVDEDFGATGIIYPFRVICRDINGGAIDTDGHYKEKDAEEVFNDTVAENINDEVAEIALEKLEDGKYIKIKTWHPEDDWREVEFIDEYLNEKEKPLAIRWKEEMKNYPVIETAQGVVYFEPSEDGTKIIYGSMTNGGIIPEGEIEYEPDKSLDWHIQGLADEIFEKYSYPEDYFNESLNEEDDKFNYMLLGRLQQDCNYFLGNGDGYEPHLWAGNVEDQIAKMKELYNKVPEKPEWLSLEDIDK